MYARPPLCDPGACLLPLGAGLGGRERVRGSPARCSLRGAALRTRPLHPALGGRVDGPATRPPGPGTRTGSAVHDRLQGTQRLARGDQRSKGAARSRKTGGGCRLGRRVSNRRALPCRVATGELRRDRPGLIPPRAYLSSAEVFSSNCRATINSWICWVPSKMSRIFASRAHFSSSSFSPYPTLPHSSTQPSATSTQVRPAFALAIEACSELGLPLSAIQAACRVSSRAAS